MSRSSSYRQCPKYEKNVIFFSLSSLFVFSFNYIFIFFHLATLWVSFHLSLVVSRKLFACTFFSELVGGNIFFLFALFAYRLGRKRSFSAIFFLLYLFGIQFFIAQKNMKLHNASFISRIRLELANTKLNFFECFQVNLNLLEADWIRLCWGHSLIVRHNFSLHLLLTHFFTFYILHFTILQLLQAKAKELKKKIFF